MRNEAGSLLIKCEKPRFLVRQRVLVGCGSCVYCRTVKAHKRAGRLILEGLLHPVSSFLTLTYSDDNLPADGDQWRKDHRDFIRELARYSEVSSIRYQAVGEYGDRTWRPHYHMLLYGWPAVSAGTLYPDQWAKEVVRRCWALGEVKVSQFDRQSDYMVKHQIKAMRHEVDPRLNGMPPEFSVMTRRPALGAGMIPIIAGWYRRWYPDALDVVPVFQYDDRDKSKFVVLDDFMLRRLRTELFGRTTGDPGIVAARRDLVEMALEVGRLDGVKVPGMIALEELIRRSSQSLLDHMDWRRQETERRRQHNEV